MQLKKYIQIQLKRYKKHGYNKTWEKSIIISRNHKNIIAVKRWHLNMENNKKDILHKPVEVVIDRPMGSFHPEHKDLYYPVNYGYVEGILGGDQEEQDVYFLGIDKPVKRAEGIIIAVIHRKNDVEDKWVAAPKGMKFSRREIEKSVHFQEKYFEYEILM